MVISDDIIVTAAHTFWGLQNVQVGVRNAALGFIAIADPIMIAPRRAVEAGEVDDLAILRAKRFETIFDTNRAPAFAKMNGATAALHPFQGRIVGDGPPPFADCAPVKLRRASSAPPRLGDPITQVGFTPLMGAGLHEMTGKVVAPVPAAPQGMEYRGCVMKNITHTAINDKAMSGGAVLAKEGDVVAMLSYGDENYGWAVPSEHVAIALEERGLLPAG